MSWLFTSCDQSIGASASASVHPLNEAGLISFRLDWLDFHAVKGTFKSLLQHHNSKAIISRHSTFFISHLYMTTGKKNIALSIQTFVSKGMFLLFNTLSRFVIGEGSGTPLQYSCLENPMDGGA